MYCKKCGAKIDDNYTFCPKCGMTIEPKASEKSFDVKSKILPLIVCCVLALIVIGAVSSYLGSGENKNLIDNSVPNKTLDSAIISEFMDNSTADSSKYIPVESDDSAIASANSYSKDSNNSSLHSNYAEVKTPDNYSIFRFF